MADEKELLAKVVDSFVKLSAPTPPAKKAGTTSGAQATETTKR